MLEKHLFLLTSLTTLVLLIRKKICSMKFLSPEVLSQLAYIRYVCMLTSIGIPIILDMHLFTCMLSFSKGFFKVFKIFLVLIISYCLKLIAIYLNFNQFVLGRDRFFAISICFIETLFFNFLYNLLNIYPYFRTLVNFRCQ